MANITQTGPQTYRQLQRENALTTQNEQEELLKRLAESRKNLSYLGPTPRRSLSEVSYEGPAPSALQQQAMQQGKEDYWGNSMFDSKTLTATEVGDASIMNDIRAENQPWYAKLGAGIAKGVLTAGTTMADGTVGLVYGITDAIVNLDAAKLFDNELSNAIMSINRYAEDLLPNYRTTEEQRDPWYKHLNVNFWADSFIKNLGFTVGAYYSGAAWIKALKVMGALKSGMAAQIIGSVMSGLNEGRVEANNLVYDTMQLRSQQINDAYNTRRNEIIAKYSDDDGNLFDPQSAQEEINALDKQKNGLLQQAHDDADRAGLGDLIANTIFLSMDNMFTLGRLYARGFQTAARATGRAGLSGWGRVKAGWKAADELMGNELAENVGENTGKYVWNNITKKQAALNSAKIGLLEGNEELMQEFFAQTAGEYYSPDSPDAYYQAMIDGKSNVETQDFFTAVSKGFTQSYGDGSQWEQFAVGMLTGLLGMPTFGRTNNADSNTWIGKGRWFGLSGGLGGEFTHAADVNRRGKEAVDVMNSFKETVDRNKARFAQSNFFTGIANGAAAAGDKFSFESARDNDMAVAFASFMNTGRESDFRDLVNQDFENMSNDELLNIARNMDNEAHQWTNEDGEWLPDVDPKAMRDKLIENRNETLKQLDEYKKALLEVRAISNNSLSQSEENEKAWERWKLQQFANRGNNIVSQHQKEISDAIVTNNSTLDNIANFLNEHFPDDEDAKFSRIGDFLWEIRGEISSKIKPLSDEEFNTPSVSSTPDKNGLRKHKFRNGTIAYEDTVTGRWFNANGGTSYKEILKYVQESRVRDGYTADGKVNRKPENTTPKETILVGDKPHQSSQESSQSKKDARFSIKREDNGSFNIIFDPDSHMTYDDVIVFAKNLNYFNTLLKLFSDNKDRDGMISAFLTSTMTSQDLNDALEYFNSDKFEKIFGKIIPNFQDFKKLISDLIDVGLLGDAYRKLSNDYTEWTKNPISIRKNRDRLDKKEQAKQAAEVRRRSKENIDKMSEMDLLRKAIFNGDTLDIDRALSDENKDQASKDKAKKIKDALNWYRNVIAGIRKRTNDRDMINGAISALNKQLQMSDSVEEFMNTNTEAIQNANYTSEEQRDDLASTYAKINEAKARGEDTDDLAAAYEEARNRVAGQNAKGREILENAAIDASRDAQELNDTADKISDAQEKGEEGEDNETRGVDSTVKPTPSGIVDKDNAEQAAKGMGTEPLEEEDLNTPEEIQPATPVISDDELKALQRQSISPDTAPENKSKSKKYNFWKSNTTEFGRRLIDKLHNIYQMTNKPYHDIVDGSHPNYNLYKAVHKYLVDNGVFDRIKKGKLKEGTEVRFGVSKDLSNKVGRTVILLLANYPVKDADGKTVDRWLPIGDLVTSADTVFGLYNGLNDFYTVAENQYNKQKDKTEGDLVILDGLSTHINGVYVGQPRYTDERLTIDEIFGNENAQIGVKIGGKIYVGKNKEIMEDDSSGKSGQPYIIIPTPKESRPYIKVPVIMDEFRGTRDNPLAEIICDMFDKLSKFNPEYIKTEAGKSEVKQWQANLSKLVARKCAVIFFNDGNIEVKFTTGETYEKAGKVYNRWAMLFKGNPRKATPELIESFFSEHSMPYQVSLSDINKANVNINGKSYNYNKLIGSVMKTNLAVGETTAVNNFFTVNPIINGVEEKGDVIQSKQSKTKTDIPQDTSGVISSYGKHKFTLENGENIYMNKNTYDITDEKGKPYEVSRQQAAYMFGVTFGLFNKDNVTDDIYFFTPFNDTPFWPSKMKFENVKINLKDATETPTSDIKFVGTSVSYGVITYKVAPKTIIKLPNLGNVMLDRIIPYDSSSVFVPCYITDKNGNLEYKGAMYSNERGGIPRIILDILNNNNVNTSGLNTLQDVAALEQQQEQQQEQQLSEDKEYQKRLEAAKNRKGGKIIVNMLHIAKQALEKDDYFTVAYAINRLCTNIIRGAEITDEERREYEYYLAEVDKAGYEIVDMNFKPYNDGMKVIANFVSDESLPTDVAIITTVKEPQINHDGKMVKAAKVVVTIGTQHSDEENLVLRQKLEDEFKGMNMDDADLSPQEMLRYEALKQLQALDINREQETKIRQQMGIDEKAKKETPQEPNFDAFDALGGVSIPQGSSTQTQTAQPTKVESTTILPSRVGNGLNNTIVIHVSDENGFRTNSGDSYVLLPIDAVERQLELLEINLDNIKEVRLRSICCPYIRGIIKCVTDIVYNNGNIETQIIDCSVFLNKLIKNRGLDIELTAKDYFKAQQKAKDAAEKDNIPDLTDDSTKSASQLISDYLNQNSDINKSYGWIFNVIKDNDFLKELVDACNMYGSDWANKTLRKIGRSLQENDDASNEDLIKIARNAFDDSKLLSVNQALESEGLWDEKKELRMLTKMLPQLSEEGRIAVVNGLIRASEREGDYAWGRFKDGIITISNHAVVGTPYHEAFHYVVNALLTDKEIDSVFKAAREKFGNRNAAELEELLSEDFRKYMNKETDSSISRVKRFWRRIKHVVNSLFGNTSILDNMYYDIMSGRYGRRQERKKVKYESFEDKLNKLNSEISCILSAAPRNSSNRLLAPNGSISALNETTYALARSSRFYEWNKNTSKTTGTDVVRTRNGDPAVLYLAPQRWNIFTTERITEYDKPYFVNGHYKLVGNTILMDGAFDTFPVDVEKAASVITIKPNTTGNVEKYMRASDIRDYHLWKTDYNNLNAEQKEFVDRMSRHEWQALDADTRDLALYCIM